MQIIIDRTDQNDIQTIGLLRLYTEAELVKFSCKTLELPWRDNQRRLSCIPAGRYQALRHECPRFGNSIWINGVPGRTGILLRSHKYDNDTLNGILVGREFKNRNGNEQLDVTYSRATMNRLYDYCPISVEILIRDRFKIPQSSDYARLRENTPVSGDY